MQYQSVSGTYFLLQISIIPKCINQGRDDKVNFKGRNSPHVELPKMRNTVLTLFIRFRYI